MDDWLNDGCARHDPFVDDYCYVFDAQTIGFLLQLGDFGVFGSLFPRVLEVVVARYGFGVLPSLQALESLLVVDYDSVQCFV